eukprot:gene1493-biopygen1237
MIPYWVEAKHLKETNRGSQAFERNHRRGIWKSTADADSKGPNIKERHHHTEVRADSAHMAANLVENVKATLTGYPIAAVFRWLDSSVALHWIQGENKYKQFVSNRVAKIKEKDYIQWRHVPTSENLADIASRGCNPSKLKDNWFKGPVWMTEKDLWPPNLGTKDTEETEKEAKVVKSVFKAAIEENDTLDKVLEKFAFKKSIRITALVRRFIANCKVKSKDRKRGPITTEEFTKAQDIWIARVQRRHDRSEKFKDEQQSLGFRKNEREIYVCHGRIQGESPIFLPSSAPYTEKVIVHAHYSTLCAGVSLTMAKIREDFWIPRLRQLTKRVIKSCHACKRFHAVPYSSPKPGPFPTTRTEGKRPFEWAWTLQVQSDTCQRGRPKERPI